MPGTGFPRVDKSFTRVYILTQCGYRAPGLKILQLLQARQ